jgi:carnitine O-acetyltransferase
MKLLQKSIQMSKRFTSGNVGILYKHQSSLPKLPVPTLEETCKKYLETVKPLVSPLQFNKTLEIVTKFQQDGQMGPVLQKRLLDRGSSTETSWLFEWWNEYAYMGYRDPVVINVNYFFAFNDDKKRMDPVKRAASIITGAMQFRDMIIDESLPPDSTKQGPLCSEQYRYLFNSCRIPAIPNDTTRVSDLVENSHIVVMRKNQFFKVPLVHPDGQRLHTAEIEEQLKFIYQNAQGIVTSVGSLTTENRDVWANSREELLQISDQNKVSLDEIERAAFVVCLDDSEPVTRDELSAACWHGDGRNRFFDKSMQFIIFDNGKAGFNGEHSNMEATITHRVCDWVCENLALGKIDHGSNHVKSMNPPQELRFDFSPSLYVAVNNAYKQFAQLASKHDLRVVCFEGYGKNTIKKFQVSPDAFAQMAIQLAYYKMYGQCRATYESSGTRKYRYGRTETGRSVSVESVEWVKAMSDPTISVFVFDVG